MNKLGLTIKYIADSVIEVKKEKFGENFVSIDELLIIKKLFEYKFERMGYKIEFSNTIFDSSFRVDCDVVTKTDLFVCEQEIEDKQVRKVIYDKEFIYYCLCQILINKLNNSIEHNCNNCNTECTGLFNQSHSKPNNCAKWTHDFVKDCINNISLKERALLEEEQKPQNSVGNSKENNWIQEIQKIASRLTKEKSMELIANREEYIQQQMQKITEEEYQSEVLGMPENENYDDGDINMILGPGYPTNLSNKNDGQEKKLVKKREDLNESS